MRHTASGDSTDPKGFKNFKIGNQSFHRHKTHHATQIVIDKFNDVQSDNRMKETQPISPSHFASISKMSPNIKHHKSPSSDRISTYMSNSYQDRKRDDEAMYAEI